MILQYTKQEGNHCQVATPVLRCTKTFAVFPGQENRMAISYSHWLFVCINRFSVRWLQNLLRSSEPPPYASLM